MRRVWIYAGAAGALALAVVLAAASFAEQPGALTNWQALVLGLVQGFTELLPISSSGHLILVPWLADWTYLEQHDEFNQTFDVALHLGTLIAVGLYFRRDVADLVRAWLGSVRRRSVESADERVAWLVVVATIPAAAAGALGEGFIVDNLGEPWQIAILMAVFAIVLWVADRSAAERKVGDMRLRDGVTIGLAQVLALAPGVSRSGVTISAARFLAPRPRLGRALLVPSPPADHARRRRLEGRHGRAAGRPAARVGGAVPGRDDRRGGQRPRRHLGAARLRAAPLVHGVRRLPADRRGGHPARDRVGRTERGLLTRANLAAGLVDARDSSPDLRLILS